MNINYQIYFCITLKGKYIFICLTNVSCQFTFVNIPADKATIFCVWLNMYLYYDLNYQIDF